MRLRVKDGVLKAGDMAIATGFGNDDYEDFRRDLLMDNFEANLPDIKTSPEASLLWKVAKNHDNMAICVGNGDSFHNNIYTLKMLYDKKQPAIIACDRVFNKLKEHGIKPTITILLSL